LYILEKNIILLREIVIFASATYKEYAKKHESLRLKRAFLQVMHIFYIKITNSSLKYIFFINIIEGV